jgi:hypothetical protein
MLAGSQYSLKSKLMLEKLSFSQDYKYFVYIVKNRKKHCVQRNFKGEIEKVLYKGKLYEFEQDFEFYD